MPHSTLIMLIGETMRIIYFLFLMILCFAFNSFSDDRISLTTTNYRSGTNELVQRGDSKIYSLNFVATSNNGDFYILDSLTDTTTTGSISDIKAEGKEATSGNTYIRDFGNRPLELSTGLYVVVNNGYLIITYD